MAQVALRKVVKMFDKTPAVQGIDLDIADREFVVLVGPSGCGKTTTLNIVAGFEVPDAGDVRIDGESMLGTPSYRRKLGMVFQNFALFSHLTVAENIAYGLAGLPRAERTAKVERLLDRYLGTSENEWEPSGAARG